MGLNRSLIGKSYPETSFRITPEGADAYTRAINEDNPRLLGPNAEMAPPMFAVTWLLEPILNGLFDQDLLGDANIGRMLHGEQDMRFLLPARPGDEVRTRARVAAIEDKGSGELLSMEFESTTSDGRRLLEATSRFFFRGPPGGKKERRAEEPPVPPAPLFERSIAVDQDQTFRYAEASGDHNPIHIDEEMARAMGFPTYVVHGLCAMALAQKTIIDGAAAGDPGRLRRLAVRFAKPVHPGDLLTTTAWLQAEISVGRRLGFLVRNQRGDEVIRDGIAEIGTNKQ